MNKKIFLIMRYNEKSMILGSHKVTIIKTLVRTKVLSFFPHISRIFPAKATIFLGRVTLLIILMTIFLLLLWNFYIPLGGKKPGPSMSTSLLPQISAGDKTENLSDLWQEVTLQYPGYRDGFVQLAKWQYFSGKRQDAHDSLQKARNLDPNNQDIQLLLQNLAD